MANEFSDPQNHDSDPADNEPAAVETKNLLVDVLEQKTRSGTRRASFHGFSVGLKLCLPDDQSVVFAAEYVPERVFDELKGNARIGEIQRMTRVGSLWDVERYRFVLSTDGTIEMEKEHELNDPQEEYANERELDEAFSNDDEQAFKDEVRRQRKSILAAAKGRKLEREMGLAFVSQTEALKLLEDLQKARPYSLT